MAVLSGEILVVNAGSTTLKLDLVDDDESTTTIDSLADAEAAVAAGHRIVHGGPAFVAPTLVDDHVLGELAALVELAPLHNGPALAALHDARRALPDVPQVAVFDTAFHRTIPEMASTYPLPARYREQGVRRYGFHGLSVAWSAERVAVERLVVCHLGGGSSVTAVLRGESIDTTMGFTPLEGVPMATRAGSIDPGALLYLLRRGSSVEELDHALEYESGLLGLGGSADVRELEQSDAPSAQLALTILAYKVAQAVAAMTTALGGLDALVFTGGVGEHSARVRAEVCRWLGVLGVALDEKRNAEARGDAQIELAGSQARVSVVVSREDVMIARAVRRVVEGL